MMKLSGMIFLLTGFFSAISLLAEIDPDLLRAPRRMTPRRSIRLV